MLQLCTFYTVTTPKVYFDRTAPLPHPYSFITCLAVSIAFSLFFIKHKLSSLSSLFTPFPPFSWPHSTLWLPELFLLLHNLSTWAPRQLLAIPFHLIPVLPLPLFTHLPTTSTSPLPPPSFSLISTSPANPRRRPRVYPPVLPLSWFMPL